jgi:hypothetical protein
MNLSRLLAVVFASTLIPTAFAEGDIAIFSGLQKVKIVGGGSSTGTEVETDKFKRPVYLAINTATGEFQRITLTKKGKTYTVSGASTFDQVFVSSGGRRSKDFVRLFSHQRVNNGVAFVNTTNQLDGRVQESVQGQVNLNRAYARALTWRLEVQDSGDTPGGGSEKPLLNSSRATLSIDKKLTKTANETNSTLSAAVDIIRGALAERGFQDVTP